jgi:hypothetical protein
MGTCYFGGTFRCKSFETFFFSSVNYESRCTFTTGCILIVGPCIFLVFKNMLAVLRRFVAHRPPRTYCRWTSNDFELADFYQIATLMSFIILLDWDLVQCLGCCIGFNSSSLNNFFFFFIK